MIYWSAVNHGNLNFQSYIWTDIESVRWHFSHGGVLGDGDKVIRSFDLWVYNLEFGSLDGFSGGRDGNKSK